MDACMHICVSVSACKQRRKINTTKKHMIISLVDESTVVFLYFLNIQDVLECIYDFYNQKKKCV